MAQLLSEKEQKLITEYFRLGNQTKAYMSVYPDKSENYARKNAYLKIRKVMAKLTENEIYEYANLGLGRFYSKLDELLDCTQFVYDKMGNFVAENPDRRVQLQALNLLGKVLKVGIEKTQGDATEEPIDAIEIVDTIESPGTIDEIELTDDGQGPNEIDD